MKKNQFAKAMRMALMPYGITVPFFVPLASINESRNWVTVPEYYLAHAALPPEAMDSIYDAIAARMKRSQEHRALEGYFRHPEYRELLKNAPNNDAKVLFCESFEEGKFRHRLPEIKEALRELADSRQGVECHYPELKRRLRAYTSAVNLLLGHRLKSHKSSLLEWIGKGLPEELSSKLGREVHLRAVRVPSGAAYKFEQRKHEQAALNNGGRPRQITYRLPVWRIKSTPAPARFHKRSR